MTFQHFRKIVSKLEQGRQAATKLILQIRPDLSSNGQFVPNRIDDNQPAALK
ncbi:hypothetical protein HMPREF9418_2512 [Neisseria macacae ATCC 33926]|uniref:Uncharacterized protein n=1 Tax=Neisseria macacae ATCC 33926 TaxID=997348 RepID=A0AA36UH12_9NEIS|nr:hypothetical protein HMPREF9418_2512 [Neisseria macacae ATCC 33926]